MSRLVVLLRGVNVGGNRKLAMASLRGGLAAAGCTEVVTYIQSGNVVLTPPEPEHEGLQAWLELVIGNIAGFDVPVAMRWLTELEAVVARNPYREMQGTQLHVVFLDEAPEAGWLDALDLASFEPETCTLIGRDLYLAVPNGLGQSKLAVAVDRMLRKAKLSNTTRNWNTVLKLLQL
jgi:uncharacterized protein (DUF1697 family)